MATEDGPLGPTGSPLIIRPGGLCLMVPAPVPGPLSLSSLPKGASVSAMAVPPTSIFFPVGGTSRTPGRS